MNTAMTIKDIALMLKVTEKTIYRLVQHGDLPGFKVGGTWRFLRDDIEVWISDQKTLAGENS